MKHRHIIVGEDYLQAVDFKATGGGELSSNPKDRQEQASHLRNLYQQAIDRALANRAALNLPANKTASGTYLEVKVDDTVNWDALDSSHGAKLMNIKSQDENADSHQLSATLFLPDKNNQWLNKKLDQYSDTRKDKKNGQPANAPLINNIEDINVSDILDLFTLKEDRENFSNLPSEVTENFEVWIEKRSGNFNIENIFERLDYLHISYSRKYLDFTELTVVLIQTTKAVLSKLSNVVDNIAEIRIFRKVSELLDINNYEQYEWLQAIRTTTNPVEPLTRIGILDSGVNNHHPLLQDYLSDGRCHNATKSPSKRDLENHGTLMAGLIQYGDLSDFIHYPYPLEVCTDLSSVKIKPGGDEPQNDHLLYGVIGEDAIKKAREDGATIQCSAVTGDEVINEVQSSWSSAIDETIYNDGEGDVLLFVSAGNTYGEDGVKYPEYNITSAIKDPAQSWNALTVGAYTDKCIITNPEYDGLQPIALRGGLCPYSSTSVMWGQDLIKPEILMEGGNAIERNGLPSSAPSDLVLVSTSARTDIRYFDAINATSAATALAARLAGEIKHENHNLSALSIRALMVHSAEWTDEMKRQNTDNGKLNKNNLLHTCGYGVPNKDKAIASDDSYATFIAEEVINPLAEAKDGTCKLNAMHVYELPWPKEILEHMGDTEVTLKVTLSYYIEPAPGSKTKMNKYRYPSMRLSFDVNNPTENKEQFISRVSHISQEGVEKVKNGSSRWGLGSNFRKHGCLISDYIKASAADIASCNMIAIYPVTGWWKYRRFSEDRKIKYSLVVSIETPGVDIYNSIAQQVEIEI